MNFYLKKYKLTAFVPSFLVQISGIWQRVVGKKKKKVGLCKSVTVDHISCGWSYNCRELTWNSQPVKNKNYRKHTPKKNNHTHKIIFTWFNNLPTSTELQRFHYYQGKNTKCGHTVFLFVKNYNNKP